jgi:hypothetical protein
MRKLVISVIALLALFSLIRAFPQTTASKTPTAPKAPTASKTPTAPKTPTASKGSVTRGIELHPGLVEVGDGTSSFGLAFGLLSGRDGERGLWNVLPLRLTVRSGEKSLTLGMNGLSFLLRGGVRLGRPVLVRIPVQGDVISVGGRITVDARVDGDVWALGADVALTPKAEVSGRVVAIGGKVAANARARVAGGITALPELKIPFLGALATTASVPLIELGREALGFLLLALALFAVTYYLRTHAHGLVNSIPSAWRASLLTVVVALVAVPALVILLVVSVFGIFLLPVLALLLVAAALDGFLALAARIGAAVRAGTGADSLHLFTSGLLGLFLFKAPAMVGALLPLIRSELAGRIGEILRMVSLGLTAAGFLYGFGAFLAYARKPAR